MTMTTTTLIPGSAGIAVVGSTMIEQFTYMKCAPKPGETVVGERTAIGYGGKGANQAVMACNLGTRVALVNCLGDDMHGEEYKSKLESMGIDVTHVRTVKGMESGSAPIWVEADGTNRIIVVPGANNELTESQAASAVSALKPTVVRQSSIPLSILALVNDLKALAPAISEHTGGGAIRNPATRDSGCLAAAIELGATTVLNPAPAATIEPELLSSATWLIPNESEFAVLASDSPLTSSTAPLTDAALVAFASRLHAQSARTRLLVTLGAAGVALVAPDGKTVQRIAAPRTDDVVDTTGAGDAFIGAFAHGIAEGLSEVDAINLGMACASDSVRREGSQSSFPTRVAL